MKRFSIYIFLAFLLLFGCNNKDDNCGCNCDSDNYGCNYTNFKYYHNDKIYLGEMSGDYLLIGSDTSNSDDAILSFLKSSEYLDHDYDFKIVKSENDKYKQIAIKLNKTRNCSEMSCIIREFEKYDIIDFVNFTWQDDYCKNEHENKCVGYYGSHFLVKVKDKNNLSDLINTTLETNTMLKEELFLNWYSVYANKNSKGDALQMANYFHETGLFAASEIGTGILVVDYTPDSNCYGLSDPPRNSQKVTIDHGLWGDIWFWSGNFMPVGRGKICQVKREVLIYGPTTYNDVERVNYSSFFTAINTKLIATTESDENGFFQIELEPGTYSVFIQENSMFYSNRSNSEGIIFPVIIDSGKVSEVRIDINYKASY